MQMLRAIATVAEKFPKKCVMETLAANGNDKDQCPLNRQSFLRRGLNVWLDDTLCRYASEFHYRQAGWESHVDWHSDRGEWGTVVINLGEVTVTYDFSQSSQVPFKCNKCAHHEIPPEGKPSHIFTKTLPPYSMVYFPPATLHHVSQRTLPKPKCIYNWLR